MGYRTQTYGAAHPHLPAGAQRSVAARDLYALRPMALDLRFNRSAARPAWSWSLACGLALAACQTPPAASPAPATASRPAARADRKLPPRQGLSLTARALLNRRMENHGFEMTNLMWATLLLDRSQAADISQSILSEPRLARPIVKDGSELNANLPAAFFALQDQLVDAASALRIVADNPKSSPVELADAFGRLTNTCVRCHAVYLYGQ